MTVKIAPSWKEKLEKEFEKPYFEQLVAFVKSEYQNYRIYPKGSQIFHAFDKCSFEECKVIILGQDPYHGEGQANGLAFAVNEGIAKPPSLLNIFKEIEQDLGKKIPVSGNLEHWAAQGVLLLNSILTVRAASASSHQGKGWETFTDAVIKVLAEQKNNLVFLLWGAYAQKKGAFIDRKRHLVLESVHPSPLSAPRGFFGCKHFSQANAYLKTHHDIEIDW